MFILYDLIFLIFAIVSLPVYLFKGKLHRGLLERLGFLPKVAWSRPIWVHAVSVGEVMSVKGLIHEIKKSYPGKQIILSTVTATGNQVAKSIADTNIFLLYLPFDLSFIVNSVLSRINPSIFIIAETEIWPNLICALNKRKIPVMIVNGRISDASAKRYRPVRFLLKRIVNKIDLICAQSERDAKRFKEALGAKEERIRITGNMKFDFSLPVFQEGAQIKLRKEMTLHPTDKLLVCGSTRPGEEEVILRVYKELLREFKNLLIVIAPRHPDRSEEIVSIVSKSGFKAVKISHLPYECATCIAHPVFILDTIGNLLEFYKAADLVFVGGSLARTGGHNILEPAIFAKPVIFGPHMFNFRDIADLFLKENAGIMVRNDEELKKQVAFLLHSPQEAQALGERARQLIVKNQGATLRNIEQIRILVAASDRL
ncbi:MAG: 3-deoxy-D-manno-octulosonic acid transferase [Candidatus Omnitrophica bacterium]|nr:3-deoxy-D-manno-octulosonic acid transferase [Candidatus Omnitrophota bacterium]